MIRGQDETRGRIERERVVRLATIGGCGRAHVALGVFAFHGEAFCSGCAATAGESPERTHAIGLLEREYQQFAAAPLRGWWPGNGGRHRLVRLGV